MAGIRSIHRGPTQKGYATRNSAPFRVDDTTNEVKVNVAGSGTTEVSLAVSSGLTPATVTTSTVTLGAAHQGRITTLNRAAGIAATLPAATGSGAMYNLIILATFTGAASIAVANAQDYMVGVAQLGIDGGTAVPHQYPTANTGTVATESDTISLFGTANSQGGFKGGEIILRDIAVNVWQVVYTSDAAGTEATPFSAAV